MDGHPLSDGIGAKPHFHAKAKCRWCGGRFVRVFRIQWICESTGCAERCIRNAVRNAIVDEGKTPFLFLPLPLQVEIEETPTKRLLVHGPAGLSKSYGGRWHLYARCRKIAGYRSLLLRATLKQLTKNHLSLMPFECRQLGDAKFIGGNDSRVEFTNNSTIWPGYCETLSDIGQHLGPEWDEILIDEGVHIIEDGIREIIARDRGSGTSLEARVDLGIEEGRTRILTNPGGRSMNYLRRMFIDRNPTKDDCADYNPDHYGAITGDIEDSPYLPENFKQSVLGGLDPDRYEQLAHGRWDVFPGQFYRGFDKSRHVVSEIR